ncbi:zinc ribbon domain-containing protein [Candidatus Leptofilum sp.]|uniref:zinc ribbon domain-containing protein n=1 Tax=Candidatus Leptofilum sp. TaxID=3241576 RepID=UPI003B596787
MSKEIQCKECGYQNPHSSKFCNNCGAKLPLSTHIICPNCETPNTRDRVFCDTCGTRLIPETSRLPAEEPDASPPPTNQPFSLPARRPGDTGELDPMAVPDWLRTGDTGSVGPGADETASDPPEKKGKGTSDLPEWLVHDSDPDPIIDAPTTISTEFYQDLVDKAEDVPQPDDLFSDEEDANLPDWLSDATEPVEESDVRSGLTDWLSDLSDDSGAEETAVASDETEDVSSGLTDWLEELDDLSNTADDHQDVNAAALEEMLDNAADESPDPSDWLQELGPAQTDVFPEQVVDELQQEGDELPGWMDELGPLQTNLLDPSQLAELTGPLTGMADDELIDDEEAGADVTFTDLFETAGDEIESLPDWLDTAVEEGETFLSEPAAQLDEDAVPEIVSEADSDWLTADQIVAETDLDWLEETGNLEKLAETGSLDEAEPPSLDADESVAEELVEEAIGFDADLDLSGDLEAPDGEDDLDWLTDMEAIQTGELVIEPEPEPEPEPASEETAVPTTPSLPDEEPEPEPDVEEESWSSETFLAETVVGDDLPDWLDQLDDTGQTSPPAAPDEENEALPDWIASMRPSQGIIGSELPGVLSEMDLRDTLEGIPEELAGAQLPDWLQDTPLDGPSATPAIEKEPEALDIPDWLQPQADKEAPTEAAPSSSEPEPIEAGSSRSEWRSLLDELPPLTPLAESLPKADIPEWVQQLKPSELTGEQPREPEGPEETTGPLKGMQGVVGIEPAIARPRVATLPTPYVTTPEQQQQVALLQQLTHEMPERVTTLSAKPAYDTAAWLRLSLALLLILALLAGLLGPSLVATNGDIPANVQAIDTAVAAAAGQPVLLAVEYTPAMAGELSPQAEMLLTQLAANNSPVVITSQYAAGTAVANSLTTDIPTQLIGYLPGEGIGLRQLGDCLGGRNECDQLNGRVLAEDLQASLDQIGLVILLTGDRDNLVNWVEQVGTVATDVPLVAGVTQSLAPVANSYAATGQLAGLLRGMPDLAAYEQLANVPDGNAQTQLNAQIYGQLLAGGLLLIGLLAYGATGLMRGRRQKNK